MPRKIKKFWYKTKNNFFNKNIFKSSRLKIASFILLIILIAAFGLWLKNYFKPKSIADPITATVTSPIKKATTQELSWTLEIKKLNITAPIILNVDGADQTTYFKALQSGVAQMKGTALPGEIGNVVVFGHSNFYLSDPGHYKQIFAHLDKLTINDPIQITHDNQTFTYIVSATKLVDPTDVSVVQPTQNKQLTLITCWPPGTTAQRLIVIADLKN
jgi:LPXTG-site transpeptidase (sortase) family protein